MQIFCWLQAAAEVEELLLMVAVAVALVAF
jgi:hypothetical protein